MNLVLLRIALFVEALASFGAVVFGARLSDWRSSSSHELARSPDAAFFIEGLLLKWGALSGLSIGIAMCLGLVAFGQRATLSSSNTLVKAHWFAAALPVLVVFWAAIRFW